MMSESIWCTVRVVLPSSWGDHPPIIATIDDALMDSEVDIEDLAAGRRRFRLGGLGNYGLCDSRLNEALCWLRDHQVPFVATDAAVDELGDVTVFDGTDEICGGWAEDPMLDASTSTAILAREHRWAATIADYFARLRADPADFDTSHLSARFPVEVDP